MSAIQPLISFRLAIDKLNEKEFNIFQNKWVSLLNRDIISSIIFQHIEYCDFKEYKLTNIMNIITDIMNQRKKSKNNNNNIEQKPLKLTELPNVLIGETASFLPEKDYVNFEISCRQTYISCNNPSRLRYINRGDDFWDLDQDKYTSAHHIRIRIQQLLSESFHRLNALTLNGECCSQKELKRFAQNKKWINTDNITTLKCDKLANYPLARPDGDGDLNIDIFCKFLQFFPNIESLTLHELYLPSDTIDDIKLCTLLPKLRIFKATLNTVGIRDTNIMSIDLTNDNGMFTNKIINLHSNQLESLSIDYGLPFNHNIINLKFNKLKELKLAWTSIQIINNICSKTNVLKRLSFDICDGFISNNKLINKTQKILIQLITTQKLLQLVEIRFKMKSWEKIIKILTNVFNKTQNINREQFKLKLNVLDNYEQTDINSDILSTTNSLNQSNIGNFMFITVFHHYKIRDIKDDVLTKLLNNNKYLAVCLEENQHDTFVVSNKNCTICGYKTRWLCD